MGDRSPSYMGTKTFQMLLVSALFSRYYHACGRAEICSGVEDTSGGLEGYWAVATVGFTNSGQAQEYQGPNHRPLLHVNAGQLRPEAPLTLD